MYQTYDRWNVVTVFWQYVRRFDCIVYFQYPIDCR